MNTPTDYIVRGDSYLIVNLDRLFPGCEVHTKRQAMPHFGCINNRLVVKVCDQLTRCPFYLGGMHEQLVRPGDRVFIGWSQDGTVVVWFTALPVHTQRSKRVDLVQFFGQLTPGARDI